MRIAQSGPVGVAMSRKQAEVEPKKRYDYDEEMEKIHLELMKLQEWIRAKGLKVLVLFEGRDTAGKGGVIKRIIEPLNPRLCRVVALATPTERERTQWYFQRYVAHLPAAGELVLFDRSWYNRAGVEHVMGFCTEEEYIEFLRAAPLFEEMLIRSGIILVKYWFSVSPEEQDKRFKERMKNPLKRWKLSPMDIAGRTRWNDYSRAKDDMFKWTDTAVSPWYVVDAEDQKVARLNCITHFLTLVDYEDLEAPVIEMPARPDIGEIDRLPLSRQNLVPHWFA